MHSDDEIYNSIAAILLAIAPKGASKMIMRATLSDELDTCAYEYDWSDSMGNVAWFTGGGRANTDMLNLLVELKRWYIRNNLIADAPAWKSCEATLDVA